MPEASMGFCWSFLYPYNYWQKPLTLWLLWSFILLSTISELFVELNTWSSDWLYCSTLRNVIQQRENKKNIKWNERREFVCLCTITLSIAQLVFSYNSHSRCNTGNFHNAFFFFCTILLILCFECLQLLER